MIPRILHALSAELLKLRRRWIGWAAIAGAALAVLASAGIGRLSEKALTLSQGQSAAGAANGYTVFAEGLKAGVFVGSILLVIFAGLLLAEETELGTAKIVFSKPLRRIEVVLAKGLLLLMLSIALVLVSAGSAALLAATLYGLGDVVELNRAGELIYTYHTQAEMVHHVLVAVPQMILPLFAALLLAFLMSALADQSGIAVGLSFGLILTASVISFLVDRAAPWLVTSYFGFPTDTLRSFALGESTADWHVKWPRGGPVMLTTGIAVSALTALAAWSGAALVVSRRKILLALAGLSLALALGASSEARADDEHEMRYSTMTCTTTGQIWDVTLTDLDQDGRKDIVAFHVSGRRGADPHRYLSIFHGRDTTGATLKAGAAGPTSGPSGAATFYPPTPDQTFEVPNEAVARFFADVDQRAPGLEACFVGTRGILAIPQQGGRFDLAKMRRPLESGGFFDIAPGTQLLDWDDFARDLDGDARPDLFFPRKGRYELWMSSPTGTMTRAGDLGAEFSQRFGTRIEALLLNRFLNYWAGLSKPAIADLDGDRRQDVVMYRDGNLEVFYGRDPSKGTLFALDPDLKMPLKIVSEPSNEEDGINSINADFQDIDKDGLVDLILYRNVGKVGLFESLRTQVLIYRARKGKPGPKGEPGRIEWPENPDQIVNLKGMSINPSLIDVDKDGDKDLVLSSLRTDLVTNAKRALFSSVTITYYVFRFDQEKKRFHEIPDYSRDLSIDVARIEGGGTIPLAVFWGDYDGDGVPDLLSLEDVEAAKVLPGKVESSFFRGESLTYDEGEERTIPLETSNSYRIDDVNRDGKSDLLFWYWDKNWESVERGVIGVAVSK